MIQSFLDSIKYAGYLYPVSIFRIYFGYLYFSSALFRFQSGYLEKPILAASITDWLPKSHAPIWFQDILENMVIPHWGIFAQLTTYGELVFGLLLMIGFLIRPALILGMILNLSAIYASGSPSVDLYWMNFILCLLLFSLGSGRCLGFDYHFYKSRRGFWW